MPSIPVNVRLATGLGTLELHARNLAPWWFTATVLEGISHVDAHLSSPSGGAHFSGHFGERLRSLRKERRTSAKTLAIRAGISRETLRQIETDPAANPRLSTLLGLQRALGLASVEQLLGGFPAFPSEEMAELPNSEVRGSSEAG
jgi:DNA-binding XRE family transcriptional regulator